MKLPSLLAVLISLCGACGEPAVRVLFYEEDGHSLSWSERRLVRRIADESLADARPLLPALPKHITLRVHPGATDNDRGESASAQSPDTVVLVLDPSHPDGISGVARKWLYPVMMHELHHLVRDARIPRASMLDLAVAEGMADVFERDITGTRLPWAAYPADVDSWIDELRPLPNTPAHRRRMHRHPDGRKWVAHKVGTYLVDRAMRASGRSAGQLVTTPTAEVLRLAKAAGSERALP